MKAFRELLKKIGSGTHTGKDLTRSEAAAAMEMMLTEVATPAQIGAFLIAHRIKRPTPEELAGMLDTYNKLGAKLQPIEKPVVVFGNPYDGRSRTASIMPITALLLATAGIGVILHGGDSMPTKYGIPLIELFQGLGVDFSHLSLSQTQELLKKTGLGFVYLPTHFPLAHKLVTYRDQIGKRPPIATLELIWSPYAGNAHIVAGFVHPPTEDRFRATFDLLGVTDYTTVKGQEGSCDLACSRTAIIGRGTSEGFERSHIHPRDYGFAESDLPIESTSELITQLQEIIQGKNNDLLSAAIYNGGFYLWNFGIVKNLSDGFAKAESLITKGEVEEKLKEVQKTIKIL